MPPLPPRRMAPALGAPLGTHLVAPLVGLWRLEAGHAHGRALHACAAISVHECGTAKVSELWYGQQGSGEGGQF